MSANLSDAEQQLLTKAENELYEKQSGRVIGACALVVAGVVGEIWFWFYIGSIIEWGRWYTAPFIITGCVCMAVTVLFGAAWVGIENDKLKEIKG